jgi:uncharacterized protein with HEPN domain
MFSERTRHRLHDIQEDARRIESFIEGMTLSDFIANERTIFAVERLPQRITEAAIQIEPGDAEKIGSALPIAQTRTRGNRLRHEYRYVDRAVIFDLARIEVPSLSAEIEVALALHGD